MARLSRSGALGPVTTIFPSANGVKSAPDWARDSEWRWFHPIPSGVHLEKMVATGAEAVADMMPVQPNPLYAQEPTA
jgi:hypothetical protein